MVSLAVFPRWTDIPPVKCFFLRLSLYLLSNCLKYLDHGRVHVMICACSNWRAAALQQLIQCYTVSPGQTFDRLTVLSFELLSLEAKFIFALCSGNFPNKYLKEELRPFCHCTYFYQILSARLLSYYRAYSNNPLRMQW